jgi:hypothetical protein
MFHWAHPNHAGGTILRDVTPSAVPATYRPLHAYLRGRYADIVVLTFAEIEDILGLPLPAPARLQPEWWVTDEDHPSPQSRAWLEASRTAKANLFARTTVFERVAD